jgi:hypothetical protein
MYLYLVIYKLKQIIRKQFLKTQNEFTNRPLSGGPRVNELLWAESMSDSAWRHMRDYISRTIVERFK